MIRSIKFSKVLLFSLILLFVSCEANIDLHNISPEISIDPDLVVPLGGASVNLGDILANNDSQHLFTNNTNEISFQSFDSTEFIFPVLNLTEIPPILTKTINLSPDAVVTFPANFDIPSIYSNQDFDLGLNKVVATERIDSIKIASATLGIKITVENLDIDPGNLKMTLSFSEGKLRMLDGSSSSFEFSPKAFNQTENVSFANFVMNTSGGANGIPLGIKLDANSGSLPLTVGPNSKINIEFTFNNLDWRVMYGKFDLSKIASTAQQIALDLDTKLPNGVFKLYNPQIDISAVSNIGMKLGFRLDYLKAFTTTDTVYAQFDGTKTFTSFFDNKPALPGDTATLRLRTFDKDWGQTDKLIANKPKTLEYKFTAFNDTQNDNTQNFITPDGKIKVYLKTTIPFQFGAGSYYQFNDTINNIFKTLSDALNQFAVADIQSTSLVLNISNGLPVKTELSISMLDSLGNEINLSTDFTKYYEMNAGQVDVNGIVQKGKETNQQLIITVTKDQLTEIRKAKRIAYKVRVAGADINSNIYFTKSNTFNLKVGVFVNGKESSKSND
ncbi:MAG: hypothetical protein ACYC25_02815 [Paludibacter sp.]